MGIDARLHYDKGRKVTELMLELLDRPSMRGVMIVAKYEGSDDEHLFKQHFFDAPDEGTAILTQIAAVLAKGTIDISTSVSGNFQTGEDGEPIDIETGERVDIEFEAPRHLPVDMYECHDLVGWASVMKTKGALSNQPCPFCPVRTSSNF